MRNVFFPDAGTSLMHRRWLFYFLEFCVIFRRDATYGYKWYKMELVYLNVFWIYDPFLEITFRIFFCLHLKENSNSHFIKNNKATFHFEAFSELKRFESFARSPLNLLEIVKETCMLHFDVKRMDEANANFYNGL